MLNFFGGKYGIKPLILEVPSEVDEKNVSYLVEQFKEFITPLEELSGRKFTQDKFLEVVRISNQARTALIRINELRKHIPSPFHGARAVNALYTLVIQNWGMPKVPGILERMIKEIEENVQKGSVRPEKFRIMVMGGIPTYKTDFYNWLERDKGVNIVMSEFTDVTWEEIDEGDPFPCLAHKIISHPVSGANEKRVAWALRVAREYNLDGAIHISHWGCRQTSGGVGVLREKLGEIGIPLLNLDMDLIDPRTYSPGQVNTRIQGFVEMLEQRKEEKF